MKRGAALALLLLAGCASQGPAVQKERLQRVSFAALPDWPDNDFEKARASFQRGCAILVARPDPQPLDGPGYAGDTGGWRGVCSDTGGNARAFFETRFTPYRIEGDALFTGYYEPMIRASRTRHDQYQTPIYGLAAEPVTVDRAAIDAAGIDAPVLMWTDDAIAFFFLQIQGSGRVQMDDGAVTRLAYAGQNGQPYTAIGRTLIDQNELTREEVSLQTIRAWLVAHPDRAQAVMETDKSYVFFREAAIDDPALGAQGTLGANLTPLASVAVDRHYHPLGAPFYVAADGPDPVRGLMMAQDTGGAIKGAGRADIFFGAGEDAERRAGTMKAPGTLYVLLPNRIADRIGMAQDYTVP
jgi:membrane-bound lytic murein transglycosylase A